MTIPAVKKDRSSTVEHILEALRTGIRDGHYALGQRLIEADLSRDFGVGRGSLREAMARLAGEGLVRMEANRGVTVLRLDKQDLSEIYEIRELTEGLAARRAAACIHEADHRRQFDLANAACQAELDKQDIGAYMDANEAFHNTIIEISGSRRLLSLAKQMRVPVFRLQFKSMLTPGSSAKSYDEHQQIFQAIMSGDGRLAERCMRDHVRASGKLLQSLLALPNK